MKESVIPRAILPANSGAWIVKAPAVNTGSNNKLTNCAFTRPESLPSVESSIDPLSPSHKAHELIILKAHKT